MIDYKTIELQEKVSCTREEELAIDDNNTDLKLKIKNAIHNLAPTCYRQTNTQSLAVVGTGAWHSPAPAHHSTSTATPSASGILRGYPFPVFRKMTIDRLKIHVSTAQASSLARIGLYSSDSNKLPTTLLVDSGDIDTSTTGAKEVTLNLTLDPGLYYTAFISNSSTVSFFGYVTQNSTFCTGFSATAASGGAEHAQSYGALPDPFGAFTNTITANVNMVLIYHRVASYP